MKSRPILFSAPMVRALLSGAKTQTRRTVKLPHSNPLGEWQPSTMGAGLRTKSGEPFPDQACIWHTRTGDNLLCPHGIVGDQLWVRETWANIALSGYPPVYFYRADGDALPPRDARAMHSTWRPSIFMPREACRIELEITEVRAERLHSISNEDAEAEGVKCNLSSLGFVDHYRELWKAINGADSWDPNPWIWALTFKRVKP